MRYRSRIRAGEVAIFADVHVKFGAHAITADRSISEQATDAEWFDADVLIATGTRTGSPTEPREVDEVRGGTNLPVIVGSGLSAEQVPALFASADGAIVGQWLKQDGLWWNPVDPRRVEQLMTAVAKVRTRHDTADGSDRRLRGRRSDRALRRGISAKRQPVPGHAFGLPEQARIAGVLSDLRAEGWQLSVRAMFDPASEAEPTAFDTGFAHAVDVAGAFEAPSLSAALAGTVRLEQAGWSRRFATEWLLGPREFATVGGLGDAARHEWGFLALWEWNDAWSAATGPERRAYDAECDVAFAGDVALDIGIAGRHRLDWGQFLHHIGIWEAPSIATVDRAMRGHEDAADFKFTTSRHFIGRRRPLAELIAAD